MKYLAMALVLAKYLVIMVLLAGCGSDETNEAPATEEVEPDLAPIRTFETTPAEPKPETTEVPPVEVVEPVVSEPESKDFEKERDYIKALMGTLKVGDTWQSMIPEVRTLLLEKGDCKGNSVDEYVWCYIKGYNPEVKDWYYYYSVTFNPEKAISKIVGD